MSRSLASRRRRRAAWVVAIALVVAGGATVWNAISFGAHSASAGRVLAQREHGLLNGRSTPFSSCFPPPENDRSPSPAGLLEIPAADLADAPVVQGVTDAQLNIAVGHVPASVWPGQNGTAVLAAHDITWFRRLPALALGATIIYLTPCARYRFTVARHDVLQDTTPIAATAAPTLVLVTCWPIDALHLTDRRYVVFASLVSEAPAQAVLHASLAPVDVLTTPVPAALAALTRLQFPDIPFPLGTLTLAGAPAPVWSSSTGPQDAELAVLSLYDAGLYAAQHDRTGWWHEIAPGVPFADATRLAGANDVTYDSPVDVTLTVTGTGVRSASLDTTVTVHGASRPATFHMHVATTVSGKTITIVSWQMAPA